MDPTDVRLSDHFLLSDFLGNHSVYTLGLPNMLSANDPELPLKMANARALCENLLEPIVRAHGSISISYGFIAPRTSDRIVTYQDPRKPSHHLWNLGAAADVCVHNWVDRDRTDDSAETAPISLAHAMDVIGLPYSRLITYSESPFICLAASAREIREGQPRNAFYENRYVGRKVPEYKSLATPQARFRAQELLEQNGLPHGWRGQGYPSHHGGGRRQMHHLRVSKYCMVSDFLFDLQSIAHGEKNIPNLSNDTVWNAFCAAGEAYDLLVDRMQMSRFSITAGYVSHTNQFFDPDKDWRSGTVYFTVVAPEETYNILPSTISGSDIRITKGERECQYHIEVPI